MEPLNQLTKTSILDERIFTELFDQEDEIYKAKLMISLEERAEELRGDKIPVLYCTRGLFSQEGAEI